jgi:histidinol dehydrogenase
LRVISGLYDALKALRRSPSLGLDEVAPGVALQIKEAFGEALTPRQVVGRILSDIRSKGDEALRHYIKKLDGFEAETIEVSAQVRREGAKKVSPDLWNALEVAAGRVREFHEACMRRTWVDEAKGWGELVTPLERVGAYIPGGRAIYPSSVLMTAIPAKVAGVDEVVIATPARGEDGPSPSILAAAEIAGVDRVFQVGGAQAIAAMAYGTESVPRVDKICGPGNLFVTLAKTMVYGEVDVDGLYGPTETVLIADDTANPAYCAADLLAQAEHDPLASPIFVTTSEGLLQRVLDEVERQLSRMERADIAREALESNGAFVVLGSIDEALQVANAYAPEHLCLLVDQPWSYLERVRNAGGVFIGEMSPEVVGDYIAGPSHQMPTSGTARFSSVLGVHHFLKVTSIVGLSAGTFVGLVDAGKTIALAEGFTGHARAMTIRLENQS